MSERERERKSCCCCKGYAAYGVRTVVRERIRDPVVVHEVQVEALWKHGRQLTVLHVSIDALRVSTPPHGHCSSSRHAHKHTQAHHGCWSEVFALEGGIQPNPIDNHSHLYRQTLQTDLLPAQTLSFTTHPPSRMSSPPDQHDQQQQVRRQRPPRRAGRRNDPPEVQLSKALAYALRHGAEELQLTMRPSGYVALPELLAHRKFRKYTEAQVEEAVRTCAKKRFTLTTDTSGAVKFIRANQGHSLALVADDELLEPLVAPDAIDQCIHGTYVKYWDSIVENGLSRMTRNHMHFTTRTVADGEVVSGMRASCNLLLYIDFPLALADGVPFYRSSNNVVLSPGVDGVLDQRYFLRAVRTTGEVLYERDA